MGIERIFFERVDHEGCDMICSETAQTCTHTHTHIHQHTQRGETENSRESTTSIGTPREEKIGDGEVESGKSREGTKDERGEEKGHSSGV